MKVILVVAKEGIVDSLPHALLEGRPAGSLLLTQQQLQQLQRLHAAQEQAGGALTLTLQQGGGGVGPQLVGFLSGSGQPTEHILHTSQQIGHTSIQHVLQSSISHVRQASILQSSLHQLPTLTHTHPSQVSQVSSSGCVDKTSSPMGGSVGTPTSPFSPRSLTPSPSPTQQHRVVTPQPPQHQQQHHIIQQHPVLQLFHQQATLTNTASPLTGGAIKAKPPPQILPKPPGAISNISSPLPKQQTSQSAPAHSQQQAPPQGALLLNQMLPNGAVLVQQQTSSGVQFILKSPPPQPQPKQGLVLANGNIQPQAVIFQGRTQAQQVLRLVPGQMQLQQIQTSSGPTLIAVPSPAPARTTPPPPPPQQASTIALKKLKKKKKEKEEPRLDLANLIKISGIDEEEGGGGHLSNHNHTHHHVQHHQGQQQQHHHHHHHHHHHQQQQQLQHHQHGQVISQGTQVNKTPPPRPGTPKQHQTVLKQQPINPSQLLAQLQAPAQMGTGLRLSVTEDGTMVVHQADHQQATVSPGIAAAAQSQLAQLIAEHGGQILQANTAGLSNNTSKETIMQSLQTAVLHLTGGSGGEGGMVLKGGTPVMLGAGGGVRRQSGGGGPGVVVTPQNGVRLVADLNGLQNAASAAASLTEHNHRLIVSGLATAPAVLEQNRVQIVTGVPVGGGGGAGRVLVQAAAGSLTEHQNRLQIVTSNSSAVSLVSNVPSTNLSLEQQNRLQILSGVPSSNVSLTEQNRLQIVQNSLTEQQNRVIVSGVQNSNMSLEHQNRLQIVSGGQNAGTMALEHHQNRVQFMSGVQSSLTEQQNRVQIVSGVPNSNTLSLSEQNRLFVSSMPNANTLSLSEKQNLVQIVNSNISLSDEQNRLQIVTSMPSASMADQSRLHIVNSLPNSSGLTLSEQNNRLHLVNSVPTSSSPFTFPESNHVQIVSTVASSMPEQSRINLSSLHNSNALGLSEQNRLQIVTSVRNSLSLGDSNRLQVVTNLPTTNTTVLQDNQNKLHTVSSIVSNTNAMKDQRQKNIQSSFREEQQSNVQVVSALVNSDKILSPNDNLVPPGHKFPQYVRPSDIRLITQSIQKERECINIKAEDKDDKVSSSTDNHIVHSERLQYPASEEPKVQVVSANNHTCAGTQNSMVQTHIYPQESKSPNQFIPRSPLSSPTSTTFNNRPNLTVVTQPQKNTSEPVLANNIQPNVPSQQNMATTKTDTSPKSSQANRRTYDNAFLDSIAQSHPSLVINKSPTMVPCAKLMKSKKPVKKAAVVKPMMAEDRAAPPEKEDPPNLVPITVSNDNNSVVSRVQTIQLTPQKQQQLKQIQAQVTALSNNKFRSASEQATLQRLVSEQHRILLGGKLVPTVPGQHAQGVAFVSSNAGTTMPGQQQQVRVVQQQVKQAGTQASCIEQHPPQPQQAQPPQHQQQQTPPATAPSVPPQPPLSHPAQVITHANKATSPIPIQQASTQTPPSMLTTPSQPIFSKTKRASLIEQQFQADRQGAAVPDCHTPFLSKSDAVKRLIRYHTMNEPVLSEKDLAKADELFDQTAKHLLDKKTHLYNKFSFLILKESMRLQPTSELLLLERLLLADETMHLEQIKQEAAAPPPPVQPSPLSAGHVLKREREEGGDAVEPKKHCPDDEEINAQVQSAIDSILNLQRNDPLEEAVRSISSSTSS